MPDDKDMIVMWHKFEYLNRDTKEKVEKNSSLVVVGEAGGRTAMAKTVGLPLAVAAKLFLTDRLKQSGVLIPTQPDIYEPILNELERFGIKFDEMEKTSFLVEG
jgi:saccharopine dehydrogenase (NAD+, L-glutamate forming)